MQVKFKHYILGRLVMIEKFRNLGFDITCVPPVNRSEFSQENYVLTYKRSK